MPRIHALALIVTALLLSSCVANYQYRAPGTLAFAGGVSREAVLYWHKDEGRLWYGPKYEQVDSGLVMRVCQVPPKAFTPGSDGGLELPGKAGDVRVARVDAGGKVAPVAPEPVADGARCGVIALDGAPAATATLVEGTRPAVVVLCENAARPDRYPVAGEYAFGPVSRRKSGKDGAEPDPCGHAAAPTRNLLIAP